MPVPLKLGIQFTPAEITAMQDAAKLISDTINAKILLNLSKDERQSLSKVADERFIYVARSIQEYAAEFPNLNGIGYTVDDVLRDFDTFINLGAMVNLLAEANERVTELQMVAGHFMFEFMTDQYSNAERYKDKNVVGAQTVYDGLKGAFAGQGPQQPTPPQP
jgi:hypothetical protein